MAGSEAGASSRGAHRHRLNPNLPSGDWIRNLNDRSRNALGSLSAISSRLTWRHQDAAKPGEAALARDDEDKGQRVVGTGSFGTVRVVRRALPGSDKKQRLALKEFRRQRSLTPEKYRKQVAAEFSIANSLQHHNIVRAFELFENSQGVFCQTMELCAGGDIGSLLLFAGYLEEAVADCLFKQLLHGVEYLHQKGVAHCDIKPENLLLTKQGTVKITDFGCSECFRLDWEEENHRITGRRGSMAYMPPEEYTDESFDGPGVDVWACGIVYLTLRTGRHPWYIAREQHDEDYASYLKNRRLEDGHAPIEALEPPSCRIVVYSMLDPVPTRRITIQQILDSAWVKDIELCAAGRLPAT
ncbi:serine/threonine-protein kinase [Stachybotrys elegans]|uniref:Serine/threonine-protein kinase n=1 Tax=Stachybotrys elegans TaxID=80388 RepID=A0A8K0WT31_9HYPO|nr:serine/threonine-protein kinase [Stachybotrys elegans]